MTNLLEDERAEALKVIDDDEKFDYWLETLSARRKAKTRPKGSNTMSQERYLKTYNKVYGD